MHQGEPSVHFHCQGISQKVVVLHKLEDGFNCIDPAYLTFRSGGEKLPSWLGRQLEASSAAVGA